jgi:transcription elongation GreA/GreB family factor
LGRRRRALTSAAPPRIIRQANSEVSMGQAELLQLIETGDFESFDNRCLELIQGGGVQATDLVQPFSALRDKGQEERIKTLSPMVLEQLDWESDPRGNVDLIKAALASDPKNENLRRHLIDAFRKLYGEHEGFEAVLTASGLEAGRAYRNACKVMEFGFELEVGAVLVGRLDENAVEVKEVDQFNALVTVRQGSRKLTIPVNELARDYDLVDKTDFRVLRQLYPAQLTELIENDPEAIVIGLIHAHDGHIDQEMLRDELVPRYLDEKAWSKWWTKARTKLKRNKHVVLEGRAPVQISYNAAGQSLEDETWTAIEATKEPDEWLSRMEGYLKEKAALKTEPDADLLKNLHAKLTAHFELIRTRRPSEALASALILVLLGQQGIAGGETGQQLAREMLAEAERPAQLIADLPNTTLMNAALEELRAARSDEYPTIAARLVRKAPAALLDRLAEEAVAGQALNDLQKSIEKALDTPVEYPEVIYWLWKGPKPVEGLRLPSDSLLYEEIMDTLLSLGRTLNPSADVTRLFRQRMRAALGLRDFGKVREVFAQVDYSQGVTLKGQLRRLDGMGETLRVALINALRDVHPDLWAVAPAKQLAPWEDQDVIYTTRDGLRKREAERDELVNVKMRENAVRIGDAAALGDLSENSEYKFALEERDMLRAQLTLLNNELSIAQLIDPDAINTKRVEIGTRVALKNLSSGETELITFVGPFEANVDNGLYNYKAPFAQKVLGLPVGGKAAIVLDNREDEYEVTSIENGLKS